VTFVPRPREILPDDINSGALELYVEFVLTRAAPEMDVLPAELTVTVRLPSLKLIGAVV
jgi:hypothetical protein